MVFISQLRREWENTLDLRPIEKNFFWIFGSFSKALDKKTTRFGIKQVELKNSHSRKITFRRQTIERECERKENDYV